MDLLLYRKEDSGLQTVMLAILAETDGDEVWVWYGQSVIIDDEHRIQEIFGIEYEEGAFGLSSTNMLIHGDGNSNVVQDSMFKRAK